MSATASLETRFVALTAEADSILARVEAARVEAESLAPRSAVESRAAALDLFREAGLKVCTAASIAAPMGGSARSADCEGDVKALLREGEAVLEAALVAVRDLVAAGAAAALSRPVRMQPWAGNLAAALGIRYFRTGVFRETVCGRHCGEASLPSILAGWDAAERVCN